MLNFNINGKSFDNDDINLLICHDNIKNITEVKMFCDNEEIQFNDKNSDIEIKVNIVSDIFKEHIEKTFSLGERINKLERVIAVLREEIIELKRSNNDF